MLDYASTGSMDSKLQLYLPRIFDFALDFALEETIFIAIISQVLVQMKALWLL